MLTQIRGGVVGSRVVVLVGSGNNGGDALWAAAGLARRGARVDAVTLSDGWHTEGMSALLGAGGRMRAASDPPPRDHAGLSGLIESADAIVDGITGIGGRGGLRTPEQSETVPMMHPPAAANASWRMPPSPSAV
jgi:NAD(P)H-hydrate repair Nnr-like enzyme with NAD(P)H-hydrate epimerase domain